MAEFRGHKISFQQRIKAGDWAAKVTAPDGSEYGPFIGASEQAVDEQARAKIRELAPWRDLDEEPLTPEEEAKRNADAVPFQPKPKRGLSRFLD